LHTAAAGAPLPVAVDSPRFRLSALGVVVLALFGALYARLWYLQVLDGQEFVAAAATNQVRLVYEEAPRGRILDRNGKVLVDNRRSQAVVVRREELNRLSPEEREEVKSRLAALLAISRDELDRRINDVRYSQYKPIPVAEDVSEEVFIHVRERRAEYPAVEATILSRRSYPHGELGAHVLGYVGEINDRELGDSDRGGYRLGDTIGKSGVELLHERDLRGKPGVEKLQVNASGEVVGPPPATVAPVPGADVQLTLDLDIQRLAEESLRQGLEAARQTRERNSGQPFVAPAGSLVIVDPRDGSVRAMASFPTFNPNDFVNGIAAETFRALNDPTSYYPLNNRAITGQYAPGSTFKLVAAVAAAQRGLIQPRSTILDQGQYRVPNCRGEKCTFRNAGGVRFGRVDLSRSLTVSSDVYYYDLGARFWIERSRFPNGLQDSARDFGFGSRSGVGLATERAGLVPDPEIKKRRNEQNPRAFPEGRWFTGDSIQMAIGQGDVLVTPLQLANAYATFANGGTLYRTRLTDRIVASEASADAVTFSPEVTGTIELASPIRDAIRQGLRGVVEREEGTAFYAFAGFPPGFSIAGKTGTAQVGGKQDTALFAAFAPSDQPQYAIAVVLEEAGFGGSSAAPVARRIFEGIVTGAAAKPVVVMPASE